MFSASSRSLRQTGISRATVLRRYGSSLAAKSNYVEKLKAKMDAEGVSSIEELKTKLEKQGKSWAPEPVGPVFPKASSSKDGQSPAKPKIRSDESPVKPLSDFLKIEAILRKPHTADQISALWTAYHASRSSGTGRGYISAVVPAKSYEAMLERARRYPLFVLPLRRPLPLDVKEADVDPVEFHILQWGFHPAPLLPPPSVLEKPVPTNNPAVSSLLFTPLIQYKLHQTYATPYMVITHHTDFAESHGIVLFRGEITPSSTSAGNYMLSQVDAQLLALSVQRFYLPSNKAKDSDDAEQLLRTFHEKPADFEWEALLKHAHRGLAA